MFGSKLRSWMEAVRPRKKQQRKEKHQQALLQQQKLLANGAVAGGCNGTTSTSGEFITKFKTVPSAQQASETDMANVDSKSMQTIATRYSGANLSSPESAYSTGYSTDGTSPGAPPPEYYINIRTGTRYFPSESSDAITSTTKAETHRNRLAIAPPATPPPTTTVVAASGATHDLPTFQTAASAKQDPVATSRSTSSNVSSPQSVKKQCLQIEERQIALIENGKKPVQNVIVPSGVMSPRQRNRIRTNPWLPPGSTISPCSSSMGLHLRPEHNGASTAIVPASSTTPKAMLINSSPVPTRYLSPTSLGHRAPRSPINRAARCASLSSSAGSSCSSLSAASLQWDANLVRDAASTAVATRLFAAVSLQAASARFHSASDDPNEQLDDDDDCTLNEMMGKYDESYVYEKETDILSDSDPTDCETDIDTGQDGGDEEDEPADVELDFIDNGSLLEFSTKDGVRNTGHCTYHSVEVHRRCSSRRRTTRKSEKRRRSSHSKKRLAKSQQHQVQGTRSAGATPVSVRRTKLPISKLALEDGGHQVRKRSNSVCIPRCVANDATPLFDQRDKEAEKKYKELIVEAEHILMNMKCTAGAGLSPRRVPNKRVELLRTENTKPDHNLFVKTRLIEEMARLPAALPVVAAQVQPPVPPPSAFSPRFSPKRNHITKFISSNSPILMRRDDAKKMESPLATRRPTKTDLQAARRSPKYRKKSTAMAKKQEDAFSSDSDGDTASILKHRHTLNSCPQSEPVKRKIYNSNQSKTVAFNLARRDNVHTEISMSIKETTKRKSCESLRQQVLLNTISNLKRSLEDQSASLKQVYRSSQNLHT